MWTGQSRGRMAKIAKKTRRYPSDLTDEEWEQIAPLMPKADGLWLVPRAGASVSVPDHPRPGFDA